MQKLKTHRCAAKRFRKTGTGKIKRSKAFMGHLLTSKSSKRTKQLRKSGLVDKANINAIRKMMPN